MSPDSQKKDSKRKPDGLPVPAEEPAAPMTHGAPPAPRPTTTADTTAGETPKPARAAAQRRPLDAELQTMAKIDRLLADLDPEAAARVLAWIVGKRNPVTKPAA